MTFSLCLSILIPLVLGFVLVLFLWPNQKPFYYSFLLKGSLSAGLGFGISSIIFFLWLLVFGLGNIFFIFEKALLLFLTMGLLYYVIKTRKYFIPSEIHQEKHIEINVNRNLSITFYILFIFALLTFIFLSLRNPHGNWDAWAIWNMRARFIFRGREHWKDAFTNLLDWSHPDYPLLIPLTIARIWKYIGSESCVVPTLLAMFFTFSTILLIFSSLNILRSKSQGYLAGIVLLGTSCLIKHGASQYADVPLGFFFVATLILFTFYDRLPIKYNRILILTGITVGLSAWTKNEGLLFLLVVVIARSLVIIPIQGWKNFFRQIFIFLLGLIPILIIILYFKTNIAPPNDLLSSQGLKTFDRLIDFSRYFQISKAYIIISITFMPLLLIVYLFIVGISREKKDKVSTNTSLIILSLMLTGYFFIFVVTPYDLNWHLGSALDRLFLQLWPSFIFYFFMIVRTPEDIYLKTKLAHQ